MFYLQGLLAYIFRMADTIVTNSPGSSDSSAAGMIIAVIILLAVVVGGVFLFRSGALNNDQDAQPDTNINVTIPTPTGGNGGTAQ